jgi:FkbM family methyltransferase
MIKKALKSRLEKYGWFLRRVNGLPQGLDLGRTLKRCGQIGDGVLLDVGAHKGETVEYFLESFDNEIYAFEPVSDNFRSLAARFDGQRRVKCIHKALGATSGEATISLQEDSQTHSLKHLSQNFSGVDRSENVAISTVDDICREFDISRIEILKIDTEGYEVEVLDGAKQSLSESRVRTVFCEITFDSLDQVHTQFSDVERHLAAHQFRFAGLFDQVIWSQPSRLAYANALFIHSASS